jgi:LPXTG-motif cell wall-anchored protein
MWDEDDNLIDPGAQLTWKIQEDQQIELSARAEDSIDDLAELSYEWSFGVDTDGRESRVPMVWNEAGMKTILVKAIDSEGEDSGWVERWVDVQNLEPQIEELPEVMAVAEGQSFTLSGKAWDTPSDLDSLIICWDVDPGADTDGIGSADDDCDIEGENLTWSWQNSGVYNVVFHATDNDGARNSSSASVTVLNLPPLVMVNVPSKAIAGETVKLDASPTRDSPIDKEYLTVVWDIDCSVDSDGDGIKDNDADLVGSIVDYEFPRAGKFEIKAIAWDEEIQKPNSKSVIIEVSSPDMTAFEQVMESLTGETANPFFQLLGISLIIAGLVFFLKRGQRKRDSVWDEEDMPDIVAPLDAPAMDAFSEDEVDIPEMIELNDTLPLPEGGLPEGWTMEQWEHYGHQYQGGQET